MDLSDACAWLKQLIKAEKFQWASTDHGILSQTLLHNKGKRHPSKRRIGNLQKHPPCHISYPHTSKCCTTENLTSTWHNLANPKLIRLQTSCELKHSDEDVRLKFNLLTMPSAWEMPSRKSARTSKKQIKIEIQSAHHAFTLRNAVSQNSEKKKIGQNKQKQIKD